MASTSPVPQTSLGGPPGYGHYAIAPVRTADDGPLILELLQHKEHVTLRACLGADMSHLSDTTQESGRTRVVSEAVDEKEDGEHARTPRAKAACSRRSRAPRSFISLLLFPASR
jgi:hypothetical protein